MRLKACIKLIFFFSTPETAEDCTSNNGGNSYLVKVLLFGLSQALAGFGEGIYNVLGSVYIDDNVKKSKAPIVLCLSRFVHLLASVVGYSMASFCLTYYISPSLHPKITDDDPRWIGAWWIGYVVFGIMMIVLTPIISTFPKILPRAALRLKQELLNPKENAMNGKLEKSSRISFQGLRYVSVFTIEFHVHFVSSDLLQSFKRLLSNKTYVCNTMAAVFYAFGYIPFFFFQAKYIQIHFLLSPSTANLITGTVSLVFSAIGVLTSGIVLTIFKPPARFLSMWNIVTSIFSMFGILSYGYFSCTASNNSLIMQK